MIVNVIGPPGAGKTTYIEKKYNFSPPQVPITDDVLELFVNKKVFEHTGLNQKVNSYLNNCKDVVITVWFDEKKIICIFRIVKDFLIRKTTFYKMIERLKILNYYFKNKNKIYTCLNKEKNVIILGDAI